MSLTEAKIAKYAKRTTPAQLPFTEKVVSSYVISLLTGSGITTALEKVNNLTDPNSDSSRYLRELSQLTQKYSTVEARRIFSASIVSKRMDLFRMAGDYFFGDYEVFMVVGGVIGGVTILETDTTPTSYSDQWSFADAAGASNLGINYQLDYSTEEHDEIISKIEAALEAFLVILPTRLMVYFQTRLNLYMKVDPYDDEYPSAIVLEYSAFRTWEGVAYAESILPDDMPSTYNTIISQATLNYKSIETSGYIKTYILGFFGGFPSVITITDDVFGEVLRFTIDSSNFFTIKGMNIYGVRIEVDYQQAAQEFIFYTNDDSTSLVNDDDDFLVRDYSY